MPEIEENGGGHAASSGGARVEMRDSRMSVLVTAGMDGGSLFLLGDGDAP